MRKDRETAGWCHWVSAWYCVEDSYDHPPPLRSLNSLSLSAGISCRHWHLTVGYYQRLGSGRRELVVTSSWPRSVGSSLRLPPPGARTRWLSLLVSVIRHPDHPDHDQSGEQNHHHYFVLEVIKIDLMRGDFTQILSVFWLLFFRFIHLYIPLSKS